MTDQELAAAVTTTLETERQARTHWEAVQANPGERDAALSVIRLAIPLRQKLEHWITQRACRAVSSQT